MPTPRFKIILVAASDSNLLHALPALCAAGYAVSAFDPDNLPENLPVFQQADLILVELHDPSEPELEKHLRNQNAAEKTPFLVVTGTAVQSSTRTASARAGMLTLERPIAIERLVSMVRGILQQSAASHFVPQGNAENETQLRLLGISAAMEKLRREIAKAAPADARVLIMGEHGTGKELVAEAIHRGSRRAGKPFLQINCAAIPKTLIESELFGHEKGAFTGAVTRKTGLFEQADGGTLLLDEIGDLEPETQAKMLRVLQENEFVRVGGHTPIRFDVRIIAATNKDLRRAVRRGHFRSDLFYRLNVIPIVVPPLRQRREDIPLLAAHFLAAAAERGGRKKHLAPEAEAILTRYHWPGNVRELRNAMERAAVMVESEVITAADLERIVPELSEGSSLLDGQSLREKMTGYEKRILQEAYKACEGNVSKMARLLQTDRANLHRKLARYGIR